MLTARPQAAAAGKPSRSQSFLDIDDLRGAAELLAQARHHPLQQDQVPVDYFGLTGLGAVLPGLRRSIILRLNPWSRRCVVM